MLNTRNNVQGLDLLRGLCGYIVAICHFQLLVNKIKYFEYISILFVEFFFILSGFVLAPQIIKIIEEKKDNYFFSKTMDENYPIVYFVFNYCFIDYK